MAFKLRKLQLLGISIPFVMFKLNSDEAKLALFSRRQYSHCLQLQQQSKQETEASSKEPALNEDDQKLYNSSQYINTYYQKVNSKLQQYIRSSKSSSTGSNNESLSQPEQMIESFNRLAQTRNDQSLVHSLYDLEENMIDLTLKQKYKIKAKLYTSKLYRNQKKAYHKAIEKEYLKLYRSINAFIYGEVSYDQFLNKELFDNLRKFWIEVHTHIKREEWGEYTLKDHKDYKLFRVFILKFEEQFSRIMANAAVQYSRQQIMDEIGEQNLDFIEDLFNEWLTSPQESLLKKVCAQKYFYNSTMNHESSVPILDAVLPLTEMNEVSKTPFDFDVVFIPGQESHPFSSWRLHKPETMIEDRFLYKTWIKEYLIPDIQEKFPGLRFRIICIGYETKSNLNALAQFNIPDRYPSEIAEDLFNQLKAAKISDNPTILISFSFGGLLAKLMLKNHEQFKEHIQQILFIGTPHHGSDVITDTRKKLENMITGVHPFNEGQAIGFSKNEFIDNIFSNILLSKTTEFLCFNKVFLDQLHESYLDMKIPFDCVSEGAQTFFGGTGITYMIVKPESALAHGANNHHLLKEKRHSALQKVASTKEDISYKIIRDFIFKNIEEIKRNKTNL